MTYRLRAATAEDIPAIDALLARSYPRLLAPDYAPSMLVMALPKISRAQPDLITSGTYYVVSGPDRIAGAGGWTAKAPATGNVTRGVGHIRHVVTDAQLTRQGIGRRLLDHIIEFATAQGLRRLLCTSTLTARPLYRSVGFTPLRDVLVPLGPGIDFPAVEMARDL